MFDDIWTSFFMWYFVYCCSAQQVVVATGMLSGLARCNEMVQPAATFQQSSVCSMG